MPYYRKRANRRSYKKRNYKRNYKKKTAARRATKYKQTATMGLGFPKMLKMTHKYTEVINLTSTTGVMNTYKWSCNSLYDPNETGTGHQPYYFDQLTPLYDHYVVVGAKCRFKIVNTAGASDPAWFCAAFIDDNTATLSADVDDMGEKQTGRLEVVPAGNASRTINKTVYWSAKKYFSGRNVLSDTDLQGTSAAGPTEQSYFTIGVQGNASSTVTCSITAEITYIAVWKEIKEVAQS